MFTLGIALLVSAYAVQFVDIVDIYQVFIQTCFFVTPIMYPKSIVPAEYAWLINLNPLNTLIELFRSPIYTGTLPDLLTLGLATVYSVGALVIGWLVFAHKADRISYHI
jgi:ABC-type polysaccharide/polyol phosphate export permease